MAINILDCGRTDRYELEVFIGQVNFTGYDAGAPDNVDERSTSTNKSRPKKEESSLLRKYTIKMVLDGLFNVNISNYDRDDEELPEKRKCSNAYDDEKTTESIAIIEKQIEQRYDIDGPVCNGQSRCYNVKDNNVQVSMKPSINRGVICVFNCVPRMLITILQKNPLEFTCYEDLPDDQVELGTVSVVLSGAMGFTDAIAYHFYEKGYRPHAINHAASMYQVNHADGVGTVGEISIRLKLTCHGPQANAANRLLPQSDRPPMRPIIMDRDAYEFHLDQLIAVRCPPKMTYLHGNETGERENRMRDPDVGQLLRCQNFRESLTCDTSDPRYEIPCGCPCKELMEHMKKLLSGLPVVEAQSDANVCNATVSVVKITPILKLSQTGCTGSRTAARP